MGWSVRTDQSYSQKDTNHDGSRPVCPARPAGRTQTHRCHRSHPIRDRKALPGTDRCGSDRVHRRRPVRALRRPHHPPQRHPIQDVDDHRRRPRPEDPEAPCRVVLPCPARAAPTGRPGVVRGRDGGLRPRRLNPQSRRPGQGPRRGHRDLQVRGVSDLRGPGRGGGRVPRPHLGRPGLPLRVPRCHLLQSPGRPPDRVPSHRRRGRGRRRRPPGSTGLRRG
nr:hypothetical protein BJQ95_02432 [Cryobacterium sp. SO1]